MALYNFMITSWQGGVHLFSKTWKAMNTDPTHLSTQLVKLQLLAKDLSTKFVNYICFDNLWVLFQIDEENDLLFIFFTEANVNVERWSEYLLTLNKRFVEMFSNHLPAITESEPDEYQFNTFDKVVGKYVSNWEQAERSLITAKAIDTLDIFTVFFNTILQKFFDDQTRQDNWGEIVKIFKTHIDSGSPLSGLTVHPEGNVFFENIDVEGIDYSGMLRALGRILRDLFILTQRLLPAEAYQSLFFKHIVPLIGAERDRLIAWELTDLLVMKIL